MRKTNNCQLYKRMLNIFCNIDVWAWQMYCLGHLFAKKTNDFVENKHKKTTTESFNYQQEE